MYNRKNLNIGIVDNLANIAQWHHDRNLINGSDDITQFGKFLEESLELRLSIEPGITPEEAVESIHQSLLATLKKNRHKTATNFDNIPDDIGDCLVVLTNIAERNKLSMSFCTSIAYNDIKDRKGRMIDGVFVKEADLPENLAKDSLA